MLSSNTIESVESAKNRPPVVDHNDRGSSSTPDVLLICIIEDEGGDDIVGTDAETTPLLK